MVRRSTKSAITLRHAQGHSRGVTNAVLLRHIQKMHRALETRIGEMGNRMGNLEKHMSGIDGRVGGLEHRVGGLERQVTNGFADMHVRFKRVDDAIQRLYIHRVSMLGRIEKLEEIVGIA